MTSKEYYYSNFRDHLRIFLEKGHPHSSADRNDVMICKYEWGNDKFVEHIPLQQRELFYLSASFTFLIDQVMHAHFGGKSDLEPYKTFRSLTQYPQLEGHYSVQNPFAALRMSNNRGEHRVDHFDEFAVFFVEDLKEFFSSGVIPTVQWNDIRRAILADQDIARDELGKHFLKILLAHQ